MTQGEPAEYAFFICYGLVEIVQEESDADGKPTGNEQRVAVLRRGQYTGELALMDGYPGHGRLQKNKSTRTASVRTLSIVETRVIQYDDFREALNAHPLVLKQVANLSRLRARRHVTQASKLNTWQVAASAATSPTSSPQQQPAPVWSNVAEAFSVSPGNEESGSAGAGKGGLRYSPAPQKCQSTGQP